MLSWQSEMLVVVVCEFCYIGERSGERMEEKLISVISRVNLRIL